MKKTNRLHGARTLCMAVVTAGVALAFGIGVAQANSRASRVIATPEVTAAQRALTWLTGTQSANGVISMLSGPTSSNAAGDVIDALIALRALGINAQSVMTQGNHLLIPLTRAALQSYLGTDVNRIGKIAIGLAAADLDPRSFGGLDLVVSMTDFYSPTNGQFSASSYAQANAILGWIAAGEQLPMTATMALLSMQQVDGGFEYGSGFGTDSNSTALAIQALMAAGLAPTHGNMISAVAFLESLQMPNGGFRYDGSIFSTDSDASSSALAVQALLAAGEDPLTTRWQISGNTAISHLLSSQNPDGGIRGYAGTSDAYATAQVVPALMGQHLPQRSSAVAARKSIAYLRTRQNANGSFEGFGVGSTIDAVTAIAASGANITSFVSVSGLTPIDFLRTQVPTYPATSAAAAGKLVVGLVAANENPREFAGFNIVSLITQTLTGTQRAAVLTGTFGASVWDQSYAMLGLQAVRAKLPAGSGEALQAMRVVTGGWGYFPQDLAADADSTGLALMALRAANTPPTNAAVLDGLAFLASAQGPDGSIWTFGAPSANSTGLALQGLQSYAIAPRSLSYAAVYTSGATSRLVVNFILDAALDLQLSSGAYASAYAGGEVDATTGAMPGVAGVSLTGFQYGSVNYLPLITR